MKKIIALIIVLAIQRLVWSDNTKYPITIMISNIPEKIVNHNIRIYVMEQIGSYEYQANGGIESIIKATVFKEQIKEYSAKNGIAKEDKKYFGRNKIEVFVFIDINGNGSYDDVGTDIGNNIDNYFEYEIMKNETIIIDYNDLPIKQNY